MFPLFYQLRSISGSRTSAGDPVTVTLGFIREVTHGDSAMIYQYNCIFNKIFRILKFKQIRRDFFDPTGAQRIEKHK